MPWTDVTANANEILLQEFGEIVSWTPQDGTEAVSMTAVRSDTGKQEEALPANHTMLWSTTSNFSQVSRSDTFLVAGATYRVIDIDPDDSGGEGITLTLEIMA